MRMIAILALTSLAIPVRPDRAAPPAPPPPAASIQGTWQLTQYHLGGKPMAKTTIDNMSITIVGAEMRLINKSNNLNTLYSYIYDPNARPALFDFRPRTSKIGFIGIIKIEGDEMTMYFTRDGAKRP